MRLQRESPTPLYQQLKDSLRDEIRAGRLLPDQRLPSERELCTRFHVSRMTVRQAISELMREGMVYSRVGKGTYVCQPKINQELRSLTGFSQDMRSRGGQPVSRVLEARILPANEDIAKRLKVFPGAEIVLLARIRISDGAPLAFEKAYIPHGVCPGILQHDFSRESLYAVFENDYGMCLVRAEQVMEASLADANELNLLQMTPPAAVLKIERTSYTTHDVVVEYVVSAYRGDRYQFRSLLQPA